MSFLGGSGGMPPRKFWNLDAWKCYSQLFTDSIWALRTIKIMTILTIFYVYYNPSFPQNLDHWHEMINLQCWFKKYIQCFKFMLSFWKKRAQQCLPRFLWRGRHFGKCESLGSSPVKMSQALHDPSICFNFLYFHPKVNTFKTPENVPLLRLRCLSRMLYNSYFCGIFSLF